MIVKIFILVNKLSGKIVVKPYFFIYRSILNLNQYHFSLLLITSIYINSYRLLLNNVFVSKAYLKYFIICNFIMLFLLTILMWL